MVVTATSAACRVCESMRLSTRIPAREFMFGTGEEFEYFRCEDCGTLQICEFPGDMSRHYAKGSYYSHQTPKRPAALKNLAKRIIAGWMIGRPERYPESDNLLDRAKRASEPWIAAVPKLNSRARVLDVGCGNGMRLMALRSLGFSNLQGCDPYASTDSVDAAAKMGISLSAKELAEVDGQFDLITMHHSLEHVAVPQRTLRDARDRLALDGHVLVRIPVLRKWMWEQHGVNWAQLDPPRHFHLFTPQSFLGMAQNCGFECVNHGFDGQGWALAWSAAIERGMAMHTRNGTPNALPFTKEEIRFFDRHAIALNARGEGESGYFVLRAA